MACLRLSRLGVLTPICCTPEAEQRLEDTQTSPSQPTPILTQRQRAEAGRERQLVPLCSPDNFQSPGQLPEEQASGMGGTGRPEARRKQGWLRPTQPQHLAQVPEDRNHDCPIQTGKAKEGPRTNSTTNCDLGKTLKLLVSYSPR